MWTELEDIRKIVQKEIEIVFGSQGCCGPKGHEGTPGAKFPLPKFICVETDMKPYYFSDGDKSIYNTGIYKDTVYYGQVYVHGDDKGNPVTSINVWKVSTDYIYIGHYKPEQFVSLAEFREQRINKILE